MSLFDQADEIVQYYTDKIDQLFEIAKKMKSNGIEL